MIFYTACVSAEISPVIDYTYLPTESLKPGDVVLREQEIQDRVDELALEIARDYKGKKLLLVGLLKGACMFMSAMMQALYKAGLDDFKIDFMKVSSYRDKFESSGEVNTESDIKANPEGMDVIVVDDILDTGHTTFGIGNRFKDKRVASFATLTLLEKTSRRVVMPLAKYKEYIGFKIPDFWAQGYGMDSNEYGRGNPNIVVGPTFSSPSKPV